MKNRKNKLFAATGFAISGGFVGAIVADVVGGMGLAFGGSAVAVGAGPVVGAGVVAGLAAYGIKKVLD